MELVDRLIDLGCLGKNKDGVFINVFVQPRASRNMLCGIYANTLKLRITAPPVGGKANSMVVKYFSKLFKLPKSSVLVISGKQSRNKRLLLSEIEIDLVVLKLLEVCPELKNST